MAVDAMEIDSNPISAGQAESEKERKRKHKHKDETASSPSKKKRKHEKGDKDKESKKKDKSSKSSSKDKSKSKSKSSKSATTATTTQSIPDSPYSLTTATLYLPLSPISISPTHALASLLAEHLSPLLLTYYPPLQGIVLAYSNASISSDPPNTSSPATSQLQLQPQPLTLAATAGEYGVMYVYLTATFLVFRPQRGQTLEGWVNVQSEGFLGAVVLNLFSVGIERKRLPPSWKWVPPGEEDAEYGNGPTANSTEDEDDSDNEDDDEKSSKDTFDPAKEHFNPVSLASDSNPFNITFPEQDQAAETQDPTSEELPTDAEESYEGHFTSVSGHRVRGTVKFRVVDIDVIPGTERDRGFLSIEGTMLSEEEERKVVEDERNGIVSSSATPMRKYTVPIMSGAVEPVVRDVQLEGDAEAETPIKKKKSKK
ncbi:hypothetical protein BDV18DRAFT_147848 [Aspergillus unguis]